MIKWQDTINIMLEMFPSINQKVLANLLGVSESDLSKIKSGKKKPTFPNNVIFDAVFDPNNSSSPAKDTPKYLLELLKDVIASSHAEVKMDMADCWGEEDYQAFVKRLIGRTRNDAKGSSQATIQSTSGQQPADTAPLEQTVGTSAPKEEKTSRASDSFEREEIPQPRGDTINVEAGLFLHNCKCCIYCIHWNGDKSIIGVPRMSIRGTCHMQEKNKHFLIPRQSSATACSNYKANQNLLNMLKEYGYDIKNLI